MEHVFAWLIDLIVPPIALILLIWLVIKVRSKSDNAPRSRTAEGTRELYAEEEERRREGTDKL
jgi:hypothetical protein